MVSLAAVVFCTVINSKIDFNNWSAIIIRGIICCMMLQLFLRLGTWQLSDLFFNTLLHNLILEMTRVANYICNLARTYIDATYRLGEGALLVTIGPFADLDYGTVRPEYRENEKTSTPYPGLSRFKQIMLSRDVSL